MTGASAMKTKQKKKLQYLSISETEYEMSMLNAEKAGQIRKTLR